MGAGHEKQEGQHDELYKAGVGLERVDKVPRTLFFEGAVLLCCFAAFILSMSGWTPRIDLAVNNSTPFITTLLRIHLRFVLSAGSPGPELAGLDITLIPPLIISSANAFSFFSSTRISSATLHLLRSLMARHFPCVAYPPILFFPLVFTVSLISFRWTGLSSFALVFLCHISSLDISSISVYRVLYSLLS